MPVVMQRRGIVTIAADAGITGLLDVLGVTATRAYSTRKLRSAYAGSAIRIRRSSDNAETDVGFVGEDLDTAAISTFVGANSAYVVKWYDQSGSADDCVQATVAQQARIVNAGTLDVRNTKACPRFDGTDDTYDGGAATFNVQMFGALAAISGTLFPDYSGSAGFIGGGAPDMLIGASGGTAYNTAFQITSVNVNNTGSATATVSGALHQLSASSPSPSGSAGSGFNIGSERHAASRYWPGWIGEIVAFATSLSAPNITAMYANQKTYWGTP